jgi:hypothetical protein
MVTPAAWFCQGNSPCQVLAIQRPPGVNPLRLNGYNTAMFGKCHELGPWETSAVGPFDRWPVQSGFERFYGFMSGEADLFRPVIFDNLTRMDLPPDPNYYASTDITDKAITWVRSQQSLAPDKPFFVYYSAIGTHGPFQVPENWRNKYRGQFDQGWDQVRRETLARQITLGVVPPDTKLAPKPEGIQDWDALTADEKKVFARYMEIGPPLAAVMPLAAAVDPGWSMLFWTAALYLVVEPILGQLVEPLVYGHSTGLSPFAVVLAATFWAWLWGTDWADPIHPADALPGGAWAACTRAAIGTLDVTGVAIVCISCWSCSARRRICATCCDGCARACRRTCPCWLGCGLTGKRYCTTNGCARRWVRITTRARCKRPSRRAYKPHTRRTPMSNRRVCRRRRRGIEGIAIPWRMGSPRAQVAASGLRQPVAS